jgi:hypothetical protein
MPSVLVEEKIGSYRPKVIERLQRAGDKLASRQEMGGHTRGNVPPWPGSGTAIFTAPCRPSGCGRAGRNFWATIATR